MLPARDATSSTSISGMPSRSLRLPRSAGCAALILASIWGAGTSAQGVSREEALAGVYPGAQIRAEHVFLTPAQLKQAAARAGVKLDTALIARYVASRDGQTIDLQPREFALLQELMLNAARVLSREQLEERMYRWGEEVESNAVEVHVHHLRRKLGADIVKTIRGVGYVMPRGEHA